MMESMGESFPHAHHDDPPDEPEGDQPEDAAPQPEKRVRLDVFETIKSRVDVQRHMMAMMMLGASMKEIAASLTTFGITAKKGGAAFQPPYLKVLREAYAAADLTEELGRAREFVI
jgi:hypothetical protein